MRRIYQVICLVASIIALVAVACKKNTVVPPFYASTPLQALINSDTSLSVFYSIVQKAGDSTLYAGIDSITVLIPTNAAFASAGITTPAIAGMSAAAADSFLRYHFIGSYAALTPGADSTFNSRLGPVIYGFENADSSAGYFNGVQAFLQTIGGSNALVYKLAAPLHPPAVSAAQLVASDTTLSYFAEAVRYTNTSLEPGSGWNTVLAPDNSAFIAAGYPTLQSIDNADQASLASLLQYHIVPGRYFTNNFDSLSSVQSLNGGNIMLSLANGLIQFTGTNNTMPSGIVKANRIAGASVILHTIDGVLLP